VKQSDNLLSREEVTPAKQQAHLEATTCLAGVLHATGDSEGAAVQCRTALTLVKDDDASGSVLSKSAVAAALKQAAALRLAQVKALQSFSISVNDARASCCSICKTARSVLHCCVGLSRCVLRQVENASVEHHVLCKVALTPNPRWIMYQASWKSPWLCCHAHPFCACCCHSHTCLRQLYFKLTCNHSMTRSQCTGMRACVHSGPIV